MVPVFIPFWLRVSFHLTPPPPHLLLIPPFLPGVLLFIPSFDLASESVSLVSLLSLGNHRLPNWALLYRFLHRYPPWLLVMPAWTFLRVC